MNGADQRALLTLRYRWNRMADETPQPDKMHTGTATILAGATVKVLTPFVIALGQWLSTHTGVVFPPGYGADLMQWALVAIPGVVAYWHARTV